MNDKYFLVSLVLLVLLAPITCSVLMLYSVRGKDEILKVMYRQDWIFKYKSSNVGRKAFLEMIVSVSIVAFGMLLAVIMRAPLFGGLILFVLLVSFFKLMRLPLFRVKLIAITAMPMAVCSVFLIQSGKSAMPGNIILSVLTFFVVGMLYHAHLYLFISDHCKDIG